MFLIPFSPFNGGLASLVCLLRTSVAHVRNPWKALSFLIFPMVVTYAAHSHKRAREHIRTQATHLISVLSTYLLGSDYKAFALLRVKPLRETAWKEVSCLSKPFYQCGNNDPSGRSNCSTERRWNTCIGNASTKTAKRTDWQIDQSMNSVIK